MGQELVELTRKMFPLSRKWEDAWIGGLSMGGFGALRNGLKYSDTFSHIVVLSGALHLEQMAAQTKDAPIFIESKSYAEACFGDLTKVLSSDKNPRYLAAQIKAAGKPFPKIFITCGNQDSLLPVNQDMAAYLERQGAAVTFTIRPGNHEWDFWDDGIKRALEWLPTEKNGLGINSGNIGSR